jgi:peptidoglycan hydrolase-like protein with peptidoglycan-binding domain
MPTLGFELAQQSADRQMMAGIQTAQGAGAEAVIGALPGMMQVGAEQQLQLAAQANEAQSNLALQKAQAQQGVNFREATAQREMAQAQLEGSQLAAAQAEANKQAAIGSAVQGFGSAVGYAGEAVPLYQQNKAAQTTAGTAAYLGGLTGNRGTVETAPSAQMPQQPMTGMTPEQMKYLSSFRYF